MGSCAWLVGQKMQDGNKSLSQEDSDLILHMCILPTPGYVVPGYGLYMA